MHIFSLFSPLLTQGVGILLILLSVLLFFVWNKKNFYTKKTLILLSLFLLGIFSLAILPFGAPSLRAYPFSLKTYGPSTGPALPLNKMLAFSKNVRTLENVPDIARDPNDVPASISRTTPAVVDIALTAKEVVSEMAPGVSFNYWTFNGTVPGPMLRVREGDTVRLTLTNDPTSLNHHNIDLHAVTGPGGGAAVTHVAPGEAKTVSFKALHPGLYVYHCGYPNAATHVAHGMYGLILVEPAGGLPKVDKELYVVQGEFYSTGGIGNRGIQVFDAKAMLDGEPTYVVFNGRTGGTVGNMNAKVGETVRMFVGNGGVNLVSSFHTIGEIFDKVYPEASIGNAPHQNVQTTLVPAGGATITELKFNVPGQYVLVDHALSRLDRGAWGMINVSGPENKEIYNGIQSNH